MDTSTKTIHAIFLDVDGTYAGYGIVPEAHAQAVRAARAAGHKVLLCTGRPLPMLPPSILAAGFDGVIASAGAYVEVGGKVLADQSFPKDLATKTVAALDAHNAVYILEAQESLQTPATAEARLRAHIAEHFRNTPDGVDIGSSGILGALTPMINHAEGFAKVSVFESPVPMETIVAEVGPGLDHVANSIAAEGTHSGELFQRGISKADGVALAITALGISQANTIAFGDGQNDIEMLRFAGIGVAIEGSNPELVALADRTALPPEQNGIAAAFAELGLL